MRILFQPANVRAEDELTSSTTYADFRGQPGLVWVDFVDPCRRAALRFGRYALFYFSNMISWMNRLINV
jgi:hypothetical protein